MNKEITKDDEALTPLLQCANTIKDTNLDANKPGSKHHAQLFTSCLGLLAHIQSDRMTIEQHHEKGTFPSEEMLPAINLLFHDRALFSKIMSMLRSKSSGGESQQIISKTNSFGMKPSVPSQSQHPVNGTKRFGGHQITPESRKRTLSHNGEVDTPSRKIPKLTISPQHEKRDIHKGGAGFGSSISLPLTSNAPNPASAVTANFSVLAAMILYSSFQYLDQWPPVLVEAFAEDSFGQRIWVDDKRCQLLAQNLSLVLNNESEKNEFDQSITSSSANEYLKNFKAFYGDDDENCSVENPPHQAAHVNLSKSKVRSTSIDASKLVKARADQISDAESEDETMKEIVITGNVPKHTKRRNCDDHDDASSSSGEEAPEEEMMSSMATLPMMNSTAKLPMIDSTRSLPHFEFNDKPKERSILNSLPSTTSAPSANSNGTSLPKNWWCPAKVIMNRIRPRYFFANLDFAKNLIGDALSKRLKLKVKQNSSLLSTLPAFVSNSTVRKLASGHLEKWLQSPALSGLARNLFSTIVDNLQNLDPPLEDDARTIENILSMKLKSNQFNMHVEKVIAIVTNVPSLSVCNQVMSYFISKEIKNLEDDETQTPEISDELKMLELVIKTSDSNTMYKSLALSFLKILLLQEEEELSPSIGVICHLLRSIIQLLGKAFDGFALVEAIVNCNDQKMIRLKDYRLISRLIFECVIMMVPTSSIQKVHKSSQHERECENGNGILKFSNKFLKVKKILLSWFLCSDFNVKGKPNHQEKTEQSKGIAQILNEPDFDSILDGETTVESNEGSLLDLLRCTIFLHQPDTLSMIDFINLGSQKENAMPQSPSEHIISRVQFCMNNGCGVDDKLLHIIIDSSLDGQIDAKDAISLVEMILYNCRGKNNTFFGLNDCDIIWDLYKLAQYTPKVNSEDVPKLACPGLWWRVTAIALVICGKSPRMIGSKMWQSSPTLQALIKMVTSNKFRFPTTDCNEVEKEKMRENETRIREKELEIAELLFYPDSIKAAKPDHPVEKEEPFRKGSRTSARQREKQKRLLAIQREKERARELAEVEKRKQKLKRAQKSIMIFDPCSEARKPRKESVRLFFSVDSMFHLADAFKVCKDPDFILLTIGSLARDGIERAYDWLIPIISSSPDIINRLPPSASCFLLLRAYGAEGNENDQLLELSTPLLNHVSDSILGQFGQEGVQRAGEIIFYDLADKYAGRRRCARKVLQESLGKSDDTSYPRFARGEYSWLMALLDTEYKSTLLKCLYPHLMSALAFEKGQVLRAYIMALDYFNKIDFPGKSSYDLPLCFCDLLSSRPKDCADVMNRFEDLAAKLVDVVHGVLNSQISGHKNLFKPNEILVNISMNGKKDVVVTYKVVRASLVLIGNWTAEKIPHESEIMNLVNCLLPAKVKDQDEVSNGATTAMFVSTKKQAIQVEDWVMLAKSKRDVIAKRSIQSTPDIYLPRLMLCCGLPSSSFTTIITRLDRLGETSSNKDKTFKQLLSNSIKGELSSVKRITMTRMLLGRINAHLTLERKMNNVNATDLIEKSNFVSWLQNDCKNAKEKYLSKKRQVTFHINTTSIISKALQGREVANPNDLLIKSHDQETGLLQKLDVSDKLQVECITTDNFTATTIETMLTQGRLSELDTFLFQVDHSKETNSDTIVEIAVKMIAVYQSNESLGLSVSKLLLHWIPILTKTCDASFWQVLFDRGKNMDRHQSQFFQLLLSRCLATWSNQHIVTCQRWILYEIKQGNCSNYLCEPMMKCFLHHAGSEMPSMIQNGSNKNCLSEVLGPRELSEHATQLALYGAQEWFKENESISWERTREPTWLLMLMQISSIDKKHFDLVTCIISSKLPSESWEGKLLPGVLLRLYASSPSSMNLSGSQIRDLLVVTSSKMPKQWLEWVTPMDTQFVATISNLSTQTMHKHHQLIFDLSKKHPLIAMKHLNTIALVLGTDAKISRQQNVIFNDPRQIDQTQLIAKLETKEMNVKLVHWGMQYTEALWITILELILSLPETIVFKCGWQMGLHKIVNMYAELIYIQADLGHDTQRLGKKFSLLVQSFQKTDKEACDLWLETEMSNSTHTNNKDLLTKLGIQIKNYGDMS